MASTTVMLVCRASRSAIILSWFGSRCCTRMKAIPFGDGRASSSFPHASNPPAEAPTATTVRSVGDGLALSRVFEGRLARGRAALGNSVMVRSLSKGLVAGATLIVRR